MHLIATVAVLLQFLLAADAAIVGPSGLIIPRGPKVGRIVGGQDTSTLKHLHQVSLQQQSGFHFCGGSVIGEKWVVTAAHCTFGQNVAEMKVVVDRSESHKEYQIKSFTNHPDYVNGATPGGFVPNDIAVVETATPINDFATFSIDLPDSDVTYVGENCTITGWGYKANFTETDTLQETWGEILDDWDCFDHFPSGYNDTHNICIHNENSGACMGDSGGPMVCQGKLAGVTSFGDGECRTQFASVYTKVSVFRDWIQTVTGIKC